MDTLTSFINTSVDGDHIVKQPLIADELFKLLIYINLGIIGCAIALIGMCANIVNMATFVKQGFKETIDVSLMALAVTDFASLLCLLWMSICFNPSFCELVCDIIDLAQVEYITGGMPRVYFTIVSGCITSVVAFERCLCVLKPLQVKVILTKNRLIIILSCVFILVFIPFLPVCYTTGLAWVFNPTMNRSILSLTHKDHLYEIDFICFGIMVGMYVATYVVVSVCTAIIVWKLSSQSAWRASKTQEHVQVSSTTKDRSKTESKKVMSGKDQRATKTVTFIATMYIVCFLPGAVLQLLMSFVPEFNKGMQYGHTFEVSWSLAYIVEAICSSANIIVYLRTSTKFKEAFLSLFKTPCTSSVS